MALAFKSALAAKPAVASSRRSVVVKASAVPDNVVEARAWIDAWKSKRGVGKRDPALQSWMPGASLPGYLNGSLPADFGFDPLYLAADPAKLKWYTQAEVFHCRLAMLGAAGVLVPDLLTSIGGLAGPAGAIPWYEAGKYQYFAPPGALFVSMMFLFGWVETRRLMDINNPGSVGQDPIFTNNKLPAGDVGYPGGIFDPLGFAKGGDVKSLRTKEIKNGRLAMMACAGFAGQAVTTGTTPLANLGAHLADPWNTTVIQNEIARL